VADDCLGLLYSVRSYCLRLHWDLRYLEFGAMNIDFSKGQKVYTSFGQELIIESVEVETFIVYVANGQDWSPEELFEYDPTEVR
jgi:hypothetical protein